MKYLKLLIITCLLLLTTGCVSYMELNELGIIDMILIDKDEQNYIITINMLIPNENDLDNNKTYTAKNTSIDECLNDLYLETNKKIAFSHLELMALTPNIRKQEMKEIMNLFLNRVDARNTFSTIIVEDPQNLFNYNQKDINELLTINHEEYGLASIKQFDSIIKDILEMNISYIPLINILNEPIIQGYQSIYSKNQKLSQEESFGLNFITNNINQSHININNIGYKINTSNTNITVNKNKINIHINTTYQIITNNTEITDNKQIKKLLNAYIQKQIEAFTNNQNNYNYFLYLIKKYQNDYYQKNKPIKPLFNIQIQSTPINNSNIKGGKL